MAIEGLASGLEDAIKESVQGKLNIPEHEAKENKGEAPEGADADVASDDPRIQFFYSQRDALRDAQLGQGTA